jgi:hypothetical protein
VRELALAERRDPGLEGRLLSFVTAFRSFEERLTGFVGPAPPFGE